MGLRSLYKFSPRVPYFLSFPYLWLTHNLAWSLLWGRLVQGPGKASGGATRGEARRMNFSGLNSVLGEYSLVKRGTSAVIWEAL